jgi:hypothetical protein
MATASANAHGIEIRLCRGRGWACDRRACDGLVDEGRTRRSYPDIPAGGNLSGVTDHTLGAVARSNRRVARLDSDCLSAEYGM